MNGKEAVSDLRRKNIENREMFFLAFIIQYLF